jgi:hypothetical protein
MSLTSCGRNGDYVFADTDHAHDKVATASITGMILVGAPVFLSEQAAGAIETSTYSSEFNGMKQQQKETIVFGTCFDVSSQVAHLPICLDNFGRRTECNDERQLV